MSQIDNNISLDSQLRQTQSRFSDLSSEDFIKIIFTELSNQDPFKPNDSGALLDQLNSIRSIESDLNLTKKFEALVFQNKMSSAGSMIGNFVGGLTKDFNRVAGFVVSVIRQGDEISLELDTGEFIPFDQLETLIDPQILQNAPETQPDPETGSENNPPEGDAGSGGDGNTGGSGGA